MKHKPIFRLAAARSSCWPVAERIRQNCPKGPQTPAAGGDAIVCRVVDRQRPDARTPRTKPVRLTVPLTGRLLPDLLAQCRPRGNHLSADDPAMGGGRGQPSPGATESEADLSDTGMAVGEQSQHYDFYAFYPADAVQANSGSIVATAIPAVQTCNNGECNMQYAYMAACTQGRGTRRGGALHVPPADDHRHGPDVRFSEAARRYRSSSCRARTAPVAGRLHIRHRNRTGARRHPEDRCSNVLALHLLTGDEPLHPAQPPGRRSRSRRSCCRRTFGGLTLTAVTTQGKTYSYTTPATLKAGHRYSFTIGDMQAQAQQTAEDYSDWMAYLPDNVHLSQVSMPGSHDACTIYGSHYEYKRRHARRKVPFQMAAERRIRLHEHDQDHQGAGAFDRGAAGGRGPHVRPASVGVGQLGAATFRSITASPRWATRRRGGYAPGQLRAGRSFPPFMLSHLLDRFVRLPERASRRDGADAHEIREHQRHRQ